MAGALVNSIAQRHSLLTCHTVRNTVFLSSCFLAPAPPRLLKDDNKFSFVVNEKDTEKFMKKMQLDVNIISPIQTQTDDEK